MKQVAIVGAGISGLACGRELHRRGFGVTILEKSSAIGGRVATRRQQGFTFDSGAQHINPRGKSLEQVMLNELDTTELVRIQKPVYTHNGLRVSPGSPDHNSSARYTYLLGNTTLARLLATDLAIRREYTVDSIRIVGNQYEVSGSDYPAEVYDAVVLTMPAPQASLLLWGAKVNRPTANIQYRACLSILLGYSVPLPEVSYSALIERGTGHPLQWLSLESEKCSGRAPEGGSALVAQMSPMFSRDYYQTADANLVDIAADYVSQLYGSAFRKPEVGDVKRWKYSQPEQISLFENVNQPNSSLLLIGDGVAGGRVEFAFETGHQAAEHLSKCLF